MICICPRTGTKADDLFEDDVPEDVLGDPDGMHFNFLPGGRLHSLRHGPVRIHDQTPRDAPPIQSAQIVSGNVSAILGEFNTGTTVRTGMHPGDAAHHRTAGSSAARSNRRSTANESPTP